MPIQESDPPISPETRLGAELAGLMNAEPDELAHAVPRMQEALSSDQPQLHILATVLASCAGAAGLPVLQMAQRSEDAAVRQFAAQGFGRQLRDRNAIKALAEAIRDPDPTTADIAGMALGRAGKAALDPLRQVIKEGDPTSSLLALKALGQAGKGADVPLLELDAARVHADPHHAIAAAEASVQSSGNPGKGLGDLIMRMEDSDPAVRTEAADAAGRLTTLARGAAPQLQRLLLGDDAAEVRGAAATALALIGGHVEKTVAGLTAALRDPDQSVRRAVIIALASLEDLAASAAPALNALVQTASDETDLALIKATLKRIEGE